MKTIQTYFDEVIEIVSVGGKKEYYIYRNGVVRVYDSLESFMSGLNGTKTHIFETFNEKELKTWLDNLAITV